MRVDPAVRVQLVADHTLGAMGQHAQTFIAKRLEVFERMEISPGSVEFAGHANTFQPKGPSVSDGRREMEISPFAAREAFYFEVRVSMIDLPMARADMPRIVEDAAIRVPVSDEPGHLFFELINRFNSEAFRYPGVAR